MLLSAYLGGAAAYLGHRVSQWGFRRGQQFAAAGIVAHLVVAATWPPLVLIGLGRAAYRLVTGK